MNQERKELGRISKATFGRGGYQDACLGLSLTFQGQAWGVCDFIGTWEREPDENCKWTAEDQTRLFAGAVRKLGEVLRQAKKEHVADLAGTPVEVTFDGNTLKSWRILTEVL